MPPPEAKKPMSAKDKATLRAWIAEGGVYQPHWAFSAPKQEPVPQAGVHPIDAFVRDRLAKAGLKPSPEADRYALVRRVTLDLTGVPPTPEEPTPSSRTSRPTPTRNSSTACSPHRAMANAGPAGGSTSPATPTPTASRRTARARSGLTATGS